MRVLLIPIATLATVLVGCGGSSSEPPPPVNQPPELSDIADQIIEANKASQPIGFSITDEQPGSVSVVVTTDRQDLLPDALQSADGSGAQRTVLLTPTTDELGNSVITVMATDSAGLSTSTTFQLTVNPEQKSMTAFTRAGFVEAPDDEPELINAVEFMQDAEEDDFADLLEE